MHFADRGSNQTATAGILPPPNKYAHITRETRRNKVNHGFKANVGLFVSSLFMGDSLRSAEGLRFFAHVRRIDTPRRKIAKFDHVFDGNNILPR